MEKLLETLAFLEVNEAAVACYGYSREDFLRMQITEIRPSDDVPRLLDLLASERPSGLRHTGEWRHRLKDGRVIDVLIASHSMEFAGRHAVVVVAHDITQRKQAEVDKLRRSEEPFRLLVDGVKDYAIFMLDPEGRVVSWNTGAERIKGYRADEIIGQHFSRFYPDEDIQRGKPAAELAQATRLGRFEEEGWRIRKDGTRFWASVVTTPLNDEAGRLRGFSKVTRDVTERRRVQEALEEKTRALEAAQEELVRRERLAILGQLAGGVSHELRNPLGVIKNSAYYLRMVTPEDERIRKHLNILDREVERATRITSGLLDFARVRPATRAPVDLNELVREQLEETDVPARITTTVELAAGALSVMADPEHIRLVLRNLISNAIQAMPDGGSLTLSTARAATDVRLTVADTGVGIPPENLGKIFEPLFTTKTTGMGLGLSLAKRLVEASEGRIRVESTPGQGARFELRFGGS